MDNTKDEKTEVRPKATILRPLQEFADYVDYCKKENLTPLSEAEFYKGFAYLALGGLVVGFGNDGVALYDLKEVMMMLSKMEEGVVLSIFKTKDLMTLRGEEQKQITGNET